MAFATYPLDTGIRPASNTGSGEPGMIADGEVNAHLENPGYNRGGARNSASSGSGAVGAYAPTLK